MLLECPGAAPDRDEERPDQSQHRSQAREVRNCADDQTPAQTLVRTGVRRAADADLLLHQVTVGIERGLEQRRHLLLEQLIQLRIFTPVGERKRGFDPIAQQRRILVVEFLDQPRCSGSVGFADNCATARRSGPCLRGSRFPLGQHLFGRVAASQAMVICAMWFRLSRIKARTVTLKLRYADFHTLTRSRTMSPTSSELELYPIVKEMFTLARTRPLPIRLLGMQLSNLGVFDQLSLFDRHEKLGVVVDGIRERFGFSTVSLATQLGGARKTLVGDGGDAHHHSPRRSSSK